MDENPYQSPATVTEAGDRFDHRAELRKVARWQRRAIFALLFNLAFLATTFTMSAFDFRLPATATVVSMIGLIGSIACLATVVPLAHGLYGTGVAIICGITMLIPLFSLVVLFVVIVKAGSSLSAAGIEVSMFGASEESIAP